MAADGEPADGPAAAEPPAVESDEALARTLQEEEDSAAARDIESNPLMAGEQPAALMAGEQPAASAYPSVDPSYAVYDGSGPSKGQGAEGPPPSTGSNTRFGVRSPLPLSH